MYYLAYGNIQQYLLFNPAVLRQINHLFGAKFKRRSVFSVIVIIFLIAVDLEVVVEVISNVVRIVPRLRIWIVVNFGIEYDAFRVDEISAKNVKQ